jgi:4'-phosphopantetheinyl transferase
MMMIPSTAWQRQWVPSLAKANRSDSPFLEQRIHLWRLSITGAPVDLGLLSAAERSHLKTLRLPQVAQRYAASRWFQRVLLGLYVSQSPAALQFMTGSHGKPYLANQAVQFNLSHSGDWLVMAVSAAQVIGVDIEKVRPISRLDGLVQRCLTEAECKTLPADTHQRAGFFLRYWTCKEAYLKATGTGLSHPMSQVPVELRTERFLPPCDRTFLHCFSPGAGYVGAIAALPPPDSATRPPLRVEYYQLSLP